MMKKCEESPGIPENKEAEVAARATVAARVAVAVAVAVAARVVAGAKILEINVTATIPAKKKSRENAETKAVLSSEKFYQN